MSCARFVPQKLTWRCGTGALRDILSPKAGLGEAPPQAAPQPSKNFRMWPYPNYFPISCLLKFLTPVSKIPIYDVRIRANQFHFCAISKQTDRRLFDDNRAALKQQISRSPQAAEGFSPQLCLRLGKSPPPSGNARLSGRTNPPFAGFASSSPLSQGGLT